MEALSQLRNYIFFFQNWLQQTLDMTLSGSYLYLRISWSVLDLHTWRLRRNKCAANFWNFFAAGGPGFNELSDFCTRIHYDTSPIASHSTSGLFDKPWRICFFMFHGLLQQEHRGSNSVAILTPVPLWGTGGACSVEQHFFNFQLLRQTWTKWEG